jgi:hypothetical protein
MAKTGPKPVPWQERIWRYVSPEPNSGCWLWEGAQNTGGYGKMGMGGAGAGTDLVHRLMWEQHRGPVPPNRWVLHRCDMRACCNPDHLFLGTALDNMRDMHAKGRGRIEAGPASVAARTHCKNGHEYSDVNTYRWRGIRYCRTCRRENQR